MIRGFHSLGDELVHHLHGAGHDARRDDAADRLAGVVHAFKNAEHRLVSLGRPGEPDQHLRDDAKHPFAADDRPAQIVTVHLLAAVGSGSQPNHFAIGQHHLEAEHVVGRDAVFERVRPAGVGGHVAADGASRLARRIGCVEQTP